MNREARKLTAWNSSRNIRPIRRWTLSAGITELRGTSPPGTGYPAVTDNPLHEVNVQSKLDLTQFVNFDASYFYNDAISHQLPPLNRVDMGLSTKPIHGFTFSVWGRNLQQDRHQEAIPQSLSRGRYSPVGGFQGDLGAGRGRKKSHAL